MSNPTPPTSNPDLAQARHIVLSAIGQRARVYLYGSRARGTATPMSDIDIGLVPQAPIDPALLSDIRETLERSNILCTVDLVDLSQTDAPFRRKALEDAIEWTA